MQILELQAKERTEPAIAAGMWLGLWVGEVLVSAQYWLVRARQGFRRPLLALACFSLGAAAAFVALGATHGSEQRRQATLHLKALMSGVESYRGVEGAYPSRLDDLVPRYAKELHADPWGHNYVFYRGAGGAAIVSAGPDGQLGSGDDLVLISRK